MLSKHMIALFKEKTNNAFLMLKDYAPASQLYLLEARYALHELTLILKSHPQAGIEESLVRFLSGRWDKVLKNTDAQYLHDFSNPANLACIEIARELGRIKKIPFLLLLMPTLKAVKEEHYITSSYADDDLRLQDLILNDGNDHLMHIPDILDGAQEDGILKHNSLFLTARGSEVMALSATETNRLLSRSKEVKTAYDALQSRVNYRLHGDTLGAALNRLIQGLRDGGVNGGKYREREHDSGSDANAAIVAFSVYLESLSDAARSTLMEASKFDRFLRPDPELKTVKTLWDRLARPKEANYQATQYCVELIAGPLEEILLENPGLYDICSFEEVELSGLSEVTTNYTSAIQMMKDVLPALKLHTYYEQTREDDVCINLIRIMDGAKNFFLNSEDVLYLVRHYASKGKEDKWSVPALGRLLSLAAKTHPPDIFDSAKAAMTESEVALFQRLTIRNGIPHDGVDAKFTFFADNAKRQADDDSMCPPARRRREENPGLV